MSKKDDEERPKPLRITYRVSGSSITWSVPAQLPQEPLELAADVPESEMWDAILDNSAEQLKLSRGSFEELVERRLRDILRRMWEKRSPDEPVYALVRNDDGVFVVKEEGVRFFTRDRKRGAWVDETEYWLGALTVDPDKLVLVRVSYDEGAETVRGAGLDPMTWGDKGLMDRRRMDLVLKVCRGMRESREEGEEE